MAQGLGEFQSSEESEEVSVAGLVQVKSDGEIHVHLPLQEGSITTGGDTGTVTEQLQETIENLTPLHGGRERGSLVYSSSNPVSDENYSRKLFIPKCCDELVEYVATSTDCTHQEIIDAQQEKLQYSEAKIQQLELELGRRSFLEDKQKRNEKAYGQSSRTLASAKSKSCTGLSLQQRLLEISNSLSDVELRKMKFLAKLRVSAFRLAKIREGFELFEELDAIGVLSYTYVGKLLDGIQRFDLLEKLDIPLLGNAERADGAFYMDEAPEHEPKDGAFCVGGDPVQEPRSHPPTGQTMSDKVTESSVIPPRENSLDLLPEKSSQNSSAGNLLKLQSSYGEGLTTAKGDPVTEPRQTDTLEGQHMPQLCHPTDGELRDSVDILHQNDNPKSDSKRKRKFLSAKNDDDVVRLITTAAERDSLEQIERLQRELQECEAENQILQAELKRTSLLEDKQMGGENIFQLSRERAVDAASCVEKDLPDGAGSLQGATDGAFYRDEDPIQEPTDGAFYRDEDPIQEPKDGAFQMEQAPEHEPRSHPTNPKILDQTTESSVIPPRNHNLDTLHENPSRLSSGGNVMAVHSSYKDGLATVEGDPMTEIRETDTCMLEDQHGLLVTAAEGSQSPNGQKMLDRITESPVIPPRDHNLGLLSVRHDGVCDESLVGAHMQSNKGDDRVSGTNEAEESVSDATTPTDKWMWFGARPKIRPLVKKTPLEPPLVEYLTSGFPDTVPVDSSEIGIDEEFIQCHSRDRSLLESQHHFSTENVSSDASLPGASYMESMIISIEANRVKPYTVDDEVASRPDEHNRLSWPSLMGEDERGYAVGDSSFEESFNCSGPDCPRNSDHLPSMSVGNMAHVAAGNFDLLCPYSAGRSNGALNGVLSEAESTAAHQYAPGNASSNTACDQVASEVVVSEPCCAESANSRDSMSDRNVVTDCNEINLALLALAQRIQEACVASRERQIEGEQQREARVRAWNSNRFQRLAEDFIIDSLDSTPNIARALVRREAAIRAFREEMRGGPSSHSGPGEHSCVCLENNGGQPCSVNGTIVSETCGPESAHNTCCKCFEHVFSGSKILPCSHHVHTECLVGMIQNGELNCPICGRAFLRRG